MSNTEKGFLAKLFSSKPAPINAPVRFHKEANGMPVHGTLYVDHAQHGLKNTPIIFSFIDINAPELTPEVLTHIWDQAERQGYIVKNMRSYSTVYTVQPAPPKNLTGSTVAERQRTPVRTHRRPFDEKHPKSQQH